jgi:hypothetical protein
VSNGDLAIDYGTSNTVALVRSADGRTRQLLFDGSPLLPSAVLADRGGTLLVGRDAVRSARLDPARYEPNPKRRIDESEVLLGEQVYPLSHLIAATLNAVWREAVRISGAPPARVLITHPVAWGPTRRAVLADACARAGMPPPTLVPEPVAAATYFAGLPHVRLGDGQAVVVYDLGAGTFDVSIVRRGPQGFETLGYNGLDDVGGLDLDALVVGHATGGLARSNPAVWQRLTQPRDADDRRHHRLLWDDAREAKESLSRQQSVTFPVPLTGTDALLTRGEFESMAQPMLVRTIDVTVAAIRQAGLPPERLAGVFLVGGGSRIPLVATLLHQRQGIAPTALEQPEIVVAEGALSAGGSLSRAGGWTGGAAPASGGPGAYGGPVSGGPYGGASVSGAPWSGGAAPVSGGYGGVPAAAAGPVSGGPYGGGAGPVSGGPYGGGAGPVSGGPYGGGAGPVSGGSHGGGAGPVSGGPYGGAPVRGAASVSGPPAGGSVSGGSGGGSRGSGSPGGSPAGGSPAAGSRGSGASGAGGSGRPSLAAGSPLWPGSPVSGPAASGSPAATPSSGPAGPSGRPAGASGRPAGPSGGAAGPSSGGPAFPPPPQDPYQPTADDPFGPPPALSVPEQAPLWPSDIDAQSPLGPPSAPGAPHRPGQSSGSGRSGPSGSSRPGQQGGPHRPGSSARPASYPPPARPGAPAQPAQPGRQHVAHQPTNPQQPVYRSSGTTVRSRSRARFHWTDPLWLVPGLIWIVVAIYIGSWQRQASVLALTSISVAILGYAIDTRTHRRLPWWAKGAIPLGVGFALGYLLHLVGAALLPLALLLLLISVGVAWLLLRRPAGR